MKQYYARIIGTGGALPSRVVGNQELAASLASRGIETSDEWIRTRSGIGSRHFVEDGVKTSDLAVEAAKLALQAAGIEPNDIGLVVVATSTHDHVGGFPSTACVIQRKLGIADHCFSFDVQAVCSGFVYGLVCASTLMQGMRGRSALVIGAEVFSDIIDFDDRRTCVLFGDGAGAIVLAPAPEPGIHDFNLHSDGALDHILRVPGRVTKGGIAGRPFLEMDGPSVFKTGVKVLVDSIRELAESAEVSLTGIRWFVLHQANIRIIQAVAKHLKVPIERFIVTLNRHGNTSAASIPLAFDHAVRSGDIRSGDLVVMAAVGGGMTWGSVLVQY